MNIPFINKFLDLFSFWVGAAIATVGWWAFTLARPLVGQMIANSRAQGQERRLQSSAGTEDAYRKIVFRLTQGMHMAAALFALDEVAEAPRLLAPPQGIEPGMPLQRADAAEESVPYMLAWPELAAIYRGPTLTIPQALSGGMNLILVGQPGAGKTVALAHLASQIVNRAPQVESLHENIPFLIHVADLGLPMTNAQKPEQLIEPIANIVAENASVFEAGRMPNFVHYAFQSGRALLLLDGVDELPQPAIQDVASYLRILLRAFPKARVITTAGPEHANSLPGLGFAPLALMPWSSEQQTRFLERWTDLWQRYVAVEAWAQTTAEPVDTILLNRWLASDNTGLTPLEFTLKVWAAYAGDIRGARAIDAIDAHLRRLMPANAPVEALYVLGAQACLKGVSIFDSRSAHEWTKSFEPAETIAVEGVAGQPSGDAPSATAPVGAIPAGQELFPGEDEPRLVGEAIGEDGLPIGTAPEPAKEEKKSKKKGGQATTTARPSLLSQLAANGILASHSGNRLRFAHPLFMGFLAGKALGGTSVVDPLLNQPAWSGQTTALRYIAAFNDASALVNGLLTLDDPMLLRPRLTAARLLRDAPRNAPWRAPLMSALVGILQNEDQPVGLRGQVIAAFALSGDPNAGALFRQLMLAPSVELRRLAAIGAGVLADAKAVEPLVDVINRSTGAARQAACLALVQIGNAPALEAVATALLRGDEQLRIAAAEALANHPTDGREALREGIGSEDILVRRAIVYGLARVDEPWARGLIERVQVEDEQWVVRNAAVEIMDAQIKPNPRIPRRLLAPSETPWLIEFAGKHGQGVTPGAPATEIFLLALKDEDFEVRSAAINYLRYTPNEGVLSAFYQKFYSGDPEAREEIYRALCDIAYAGTLLPHPMQYGLG